MRRGAKTNEDERRARAARGFAAAIIWALIVYSLWAPAAAPNPKLAMKTLPACAP